jgi:hypothetical protein
MSAQKLFNDIQTQLAQNYGCRVTTKATHRRLWKAIEIFLKVVTFGGMSKFMQYTTTLGKTVYFPEGTDLKNPGFSEAIVLKHEGVHVRQFVTYGFLGFCLLYLFIPIPVGWAYFRYKFERDAFREAYACALEQGLSMNPEDFISQLSGAAYFWAMPKKWIRKDLKRFFSFV